jgi:transcriptional regulator with XRE-family HTH domain
MGEELIEMDNKNVFASNLKRYMELKSKSRNDISEALGISYFTVSDWVNGKKYPRMDKVEMLANYFGVQKSDLIEIKGQSSSPDNASLTEGEKTLLDLFRRVPEEQQTLVLQMIRAALGSQE